MTEVANPPIPEVASVPEDVPNPGRTPPATPEAADRLADIERQLDELKSRIENNLAKLKNGRR